MRLHRLRPDDAFSWTLMPAILLRIRKFCEKYDEHTNPLVLQANVGQSFTSPIANCITVAILASDTVVGHALITVEPWTGKTFLVVLQLEIDKPWTLTPELYRDGMAILRQIGREARADYIQMMAYSEGTLTDLRRARLFKRLGFEPVGMTMRLPLAPPVPGDAPKAGAAAAEAKLEGDAGDLESAGEVLH